MSFGENVDEGDDDEDVSEPPKQPNQKEINQISVCAHTHLHTLTLSLMFIGNLAIHMHAHMHAHTICIAQIHILLPFYKQFFPFGKRSKVTPPAEGEGEGESGEGGGGGRDPHFEENVKNFGDILSESVRVRVSNLPHVPRSVPELPSARLGVCVRARAHARAYACARARACACACAYIYRILIELYLFSYNLQVFYSAEG